MPSLLDSISSPEDLKKLAPEQLHALTDEIRDTIIRVVSRRGGHLASNLGVLELTVALHYVFDFSRDRLLWDVGHQCYAHKILTGRKSGFERLRRSDGVSGFPNPEESPYDVFRTGHAGTAISQALGILAGAKMTQRPTKVVAVVGDGSLGCGMTLEALNAASSVAACKEPGYGLLIVLNDNRMSIASSVGALAQYMSRIRSDHIYREFKREVKYFLDAVPLLGQPMERMLENAKNLIRKNLVPGTLFENFGFRYFGPVDGHNQDLLIHMLGEIDRGGYEYPMLLHVVTEKGHGYKPASADPSSFHSAHPFDVESGEVRTADETETFSHAFGKAVVELAEKDERLVAITAAMTHGAGLDAFSRLYPERFFDVGIAESHAVGFAQGLARAGAKPVCAIYSTFLQRSYDQVFHELALQGVPVVLAMDRAGFVSGDGPTHYGIYDIAYLRHLPGIVLMAPSDGPELRAMLEAALAHPGVVAMRYPKASAAPVAGAHAAVEIGRAETLREGDRIAFFAYGVMVRTALEAARLLAADGISPTVVNARFAKPVDCETLGALLETHEAVVTLEDHVVAGGFGSAVLEAARGENLDVDRIHIHGIPDRIFHHGGREEMVAEANLDAASVAALAVKHLRRHQESREHEDILHHHG